MEKSLKIGCDPPFYSDPYRIGVIMNNLVSNAIRFSDEEKDQNRIELRVDRTDAGVRITIEDNGVGIMSDMQKKVFDMFFRGSVKSEGAGLGLYIVREMVSKLKGTIQLTSNPGQGTCVSIDLPDLAADRQEVVRMRVGG